MNELVNEQNLIEVLKPNDKELTNSIEVTTEIFGMKRLLTRLLFILIKLSFRVTNLSI